MKVIVSTLLSLVPISRRRNYILLFRYFLFLSFMIALYSIVFHFLMLLEDRYYTWVTGVYWTLTTMSTLGFGDITFESDIGRVFSVVVLLSGIVLLLVMLPFTFIQFFYAPWLEAQTKARAPRELPEDTKGHVILTNFDATSAQLVDKLRQYKYPYIVLFEDVQEALRVHDLGYRVAVGELADPATYHRLRADKAALVYAGVDDIVNTSIAFTVREVSANVPVVVNAERDDSIDIMELAGATYVFQFMKMLGQSLARRTIGTNTRANVIGNVETILIAEAPVMRTPLQGKTLEETRLRETIGVTVVGMWEAGRFVIPSAGTRLGAATVLLLAGSPEQLVEYDSKYGQYEKSDQPVLILGGGRVGRAAAEALRERGMEYLIIEKNPKLSRDRKRYIQGNASDINTLKRAGIDTAPTIIITTHDDATNIFLTIYCRRLRSDIQIISRVELDRNVPILHNAGADLVMSYGSISTNTILSLLKPDEMLMLSEGLSVVSMDVPITLVGKSIADSNIRTHTGCNIIGIKAGAQTHLNPDPSIVLELGQELIIICTDESHKLFLGRYPARRT
jgi:Trk K+ transport system NAD-binding subunit